MFKNTQSIETITRALRRCADKVSLNNTWRTLNQLHGIGTLSGTTLTLTVHDHRHLRQLLSHHMGFDPLTHSLDDLKGDRIDLGSRFRNEKAGGRKVSEGIVMVGSAVGELALASGVYRLPPGSTLNVPAEELAGAPQVVLVENLAVMYALQRFAWPEGLRDLPMLFRGSPQVTPAAVTAALAGLREVICYPDYDPQGLMNSLTLGQCTAIIVPTEATIQQLVASRRDKPDDFERQHQAREWLSTRQYDFVRRLLDRRLALSQESMAGRDLEVCRVT